MEKPSVFLLSPGFQWRAGVLACSTSRARGTRPDLSSAPIEAACAKWWRAKVVARRAVPDDRRTIVRVLNNWCEQGVDVIFTTGGTGFSPSDVTPDATSEVVSREAPGLMELMRLAWGKKNKLAWLSRGVAGFHDKTLILNLPGDPAAVDQCLKALRPVLPAALESASDRMGEISLSR